MRSTDPSAATTELPLWQVFQERAQHAAMIAVLCKDDADFDSASWYEGQARAYREAERLSREVAA